MNCLLNTQLGRPKSATERPLPGGRQIYWIIEGQELQTSGHFLVSDKSDFL